MDWSLQLLTVGLCVSFLLLSGLWIPFTIGTVAIGIMLWSGGLKELNALGLVFWGGANSFVLTAIPLYILMAEILIASQISAKLYRALTHFTRSLPGGLLQTNIVGSAIFSAVCGSSMATAAAISRVALPELRNLGYNMRFSCGSLAAGGTLGILIPPSGAMIIYGVLTDTSIARLFLAGVLPGVFTSVDVHGLSGDGIPPAGPGHICRGQPFRRFFAHFALRHPGVHDHRVHLSRLGHPD